MVVGVVAALAVGLVVTRPSGSSWNVGGGAAGDAAEPNWAAFEAALDDLASAKGVRYAETAGFGTEYRDVTVTDTGWSFGQTGFVEPAELPDPGDLGLPDLDVPEGALGSLDRDLLWVDGKAYSRSSVASAAELEDMATAGEVPAPEEAAEVPGVWTFDPLGESEELAAMFGRLPTPADLAEVLEASLEELREQPDAPELVATRTVDEAPALQVDTSAGRLIVTREAPHQVLRLEPYDTTGLDADVGTDTGQIDGWRAGDGDDPGSPWDHFEDIFGGGPSSEVTTGPLADSDSAGIDLLPVPEEEAEWMFDLLEDYIAPLDQAVDGGITFTLASAGAVSCSAAGCQVTENFTGSIAAHARQRLTGGQVDATLTATVTIDGRPAGRCTSRQVVAITGASVSGALACTSPEAGPVFVATDARYRAQAQARSRASGGISVPYSFPYAAQTLIQANAVATVEVQALLDQNRRNRDSLPCTTGRGGRPQPPGLVGPAGFLGARRSPSQVPPSGGGQCSLQMPPPGSPDRLPYDMRLARAAAQELGLDVNGIWFRQDIGNRLRNQAGRGATIFGETVPGRVVDRIDGHPVYFQGIILTRDAFRDERTLRITLLHEFQHVDDLLGGRPPRNTRANEDAIDAEARRRYDEWVAGQP